MDFLMENQWLIWLAIAVVCLIFELVTVSLVSIWFVIGSIVAMFVAMAGGSFGLQVTLMLVLSIGLLLVFIYLRKKKFKGKDKVYTPTNIDALIGQEALVIEDVNNLNNTGLVRIKGQVWSAKSADDDIVIRTGEQVKVEAISGVKLVLSAERKN